MAGPEKQFENKIKAFLGALPNTYFFKYWAGPYSKSGIPDIICCINGKFVGVEVKAEKGKPTALQEHNIELIRKAGGLGYILYPTQFEAFKMEIMALVGGE